MRGERGEKGRNGEWPWRWNCRDWNWRLKSESKEDDEGEEAKRAEGSRICWVSFQRFLSPFQVLFVNLIVRDEECDCKFKMWFVGTSLCTDPNLTVTADCTQNVGVV